MFPRFPGMDEDGSADVGALCRWAVAEGMTSYAWWLMPRLMTPQGAAEWAIKCAMRCGADNQDWRAWAGKWLSGEDRSARAAWAAEAWAAAAAEAAYDAMIADALAIIERGAV